MDVRIADPIESEPLAWHGVRVKERPLSTHQLHVLGGPFIDRPVVRRGEGIGRSY